jgi:hypothetical protein
VCRLWVELICQTISGSSCTSQLVGMSVQSNAGGCFPLNEAGLQSTGAGTNGGTSVGIIQTSVASLASKPIRIIGYVEATWTSGTGWAAPSNVQITSPGLKKPCDVVQVAYATTATATSVGTTNTAALPSVTLTPTSTVNLVQIISDGMASQSTGSSNFTSTQIFRALGSSAACTTAIGSISTESTGGVGAMMVVFNHALDAPQATSQVTYVVCGKSVGGGVYCVNPGLGAVCTIQATEIMGLLDRQPMNDDGVPRLVG